MMTRWWGRWRGEVKRQLRLGDEATEVGDARAVVGRRHRVRRRKREAIQVGRATT